MLMRSRVAIVLCVLTAAGIASGTLRAGDPAPVEKGGNPPRAPVELPGPFVGNGLGSPEMLDNAGNPIASGGWVVKVGLGIPFRGPVVFGGVAGGFGGGFAVPRDSVPATSALQKLMPRQRGPSLNLPFETRPGKN